MTRTACVDDLSAKRDNAFDNRRKLLDNVLAAENDQVLPDNRLGTVFREGSGRFTCRDLPHFQFQHVAHADRSLQRVRRIQHEQLSMIDNGDPVRHAIGFIHVVDRQQYRLLLRQGAQVFTDENPALRVQPGPGLVKNQNLRIMDHGQRQTKAVPHAAR
jgi:hypothetical protein